MTKEEVVKLMSSSQTEQEWNNNCDLVKKKCGGYPAFWYETIVMGGILRRTAARWNSDGQIKVSY